MAKSTSYAKLIGGKYFNVQLDWNKQMGNALYAPGKAQPKPFKDHKIVGQPIKREDVAPKVFAQEDYVHRHQGAGHGAWPRDPSGGRRLRCRSRSTKARSRTSPAPRWSTRTASSASSRPRSGTRSRRCRSSRSSGRRSSRRSRTRTRCTTTSARRRCASSAVEGKTAGNVDEAFKTAAKVIEAEYEWPFQSHARDGPGLRGGRDQGRQGQLLERHAEVATSCRSASPPSSACRWRTST